MSQSKSTSSSKRDTRKVVCNKKGGMAGEIGEGKTAGGIGERSYDGCSRHWRRGNVVATTQSRRIFSLLQTCDDKQSSPFDPRTRTIAQVSTCIANDASMWLARYRCKLRGIRCWFFSVPAFLISLRSVLLLLRYSDLISYRSSHHAAHNIPPSQNQP